MTKQSHSQCQNKLSSLPYIKEGKMCVIKAFTVIFSMKNEQQTRTYIFLPKSQQQTRQEQQQIK